MTVVITGASRGIGKALADYYADRDVVGTATAPAPGSRLLALDLRARDAALALGPALEGRPVELLICNAGVFADRGQPLDTGFPGEMWAEMLAINVTGVFQTVQAILPNLRAARGPKVAIMSSQLGSHTIAAGGSYIYRASKAAALNIGRNLAVDLKPDGIAVGIYHPGWVRTDMGGTGADITVEEAARGLARRFEALSLATTGAFETWDGRAHPF